MNCKFLAKLSCPVFYLDRHYWQPENCEIFIKINSQASNPLWSKQQFKAISAQHLTTFCAEETESLKRSEVYEPTQVYKAKSAKRQKLFTGVNSQEILNHLEF